MITPLAMSMLNTQATRSICFHSSPPSLSKSLGGVALVWSHRNTVDELAVGIRGPDDEVLAPVNHRPGRESIIGAELPTPAGADGVGSAGEAVCGCLASWRASDDVRAAGDRGGLCVDAEGDGAGGVPGVAGSGKGRDLPLGNICHCRHSLRSSVDRSRKGVAGSSDEAEEDGVEMHGGRI